MSQQQTTPATTKPNLAFLFASKPTAPLASNRLKEDQKRSDPAASSPGGRSYPIPDFFEYRTKPNELGL